MFHVDQGVIGVRMDGIENVDIADLHISALKNESPLVSLACGDYDGPNNGGQPNQLHYYCVNVSDNSYCTATTMTKCTKTTDSAKIFG